MEQHELTDLVHGHSAPLLGNEDKLVYYYVLVAKRTGKADVRNRYLELLRQKGFVVTEKSDKQRLFFGIHAGDEIFQKYTRLLANTELCRDKNEPTRCTRIRIVDFILRTTNCYADRDCKCHVLRSLLEDKTFVAAFPLHEENLPEREKKLWDGWARWGRLFHKQPVNEIRQYFGERVALYFAWLGWYTTMLIPAAAFGVLMFLCAFVFFNNQISKEICNANTTIMCPLCDQRCPLWKLSETCTHAKVTELFDHEITVFFAMFMAIWATIFMEVWKRSRASIVHQWNLYHWDEDEEDLALRQIYNPETALRRYRHSYTRTSLVLLLSCLMIILMIGIALAIVISRVVVTIFFTNSGLEFLRDHANTGAVMIGALLHFLTIIIMTKVNHFVALKLCDLEKPRTELARENNFTVKMFTFQFFTMFSSIVYVAFFLGRINGHPNNYVRIASKWRLEECHPSGCMTDLFIQMAMIMFLKQILSSTLEYCIPSFKRKWNHRRVTSDESNTDPTMAHWLQNYSLNTVGSFSLFKEFLEMVIQYGFTTIFVAAFPLAPLLALINNLLEIRLDARKMLVLQKRAVPRKANDIGIWLPVLEAIGVLAVIGNGLVISITSDFIPRLVYKYQYGPCARGHSTEDCLTGYINNSLSVFYLNKMDNKTQPRITNSELEITYCRYRDYRNSQDYGYTVQFWHILAARLAFLVLFENVALCVKYIAAWYVPDVPITVKNQYLTRTNSRLEERHKHLLNENQRPLLVNLHSDVRSTDV
ncbi:anoctamin-9 [Callorhinchus milii]|uniref:anoctamin-9 n=1 Tax=Callorhinchus milii TaxID=7868 RepID=UPI001C3F7417|nr:anoctamin-9 [Callorhinchus milii]